MFEKIKLLALEARIHLYGVLREHYNCMVMRYPYYLDKMTEYNDKLMMIESKYVKVTTNKEKT